MKKKLNDSSKSKYLLIAITIFCGVMISLSLTLDPVSGPLGYVTGYLITPIQNGINQAGSWLAERGVYFQNSTNVAAENKALQEKVDTLTAENNQLLQDKEELDRLRDLLELDHQYDDYEKIGARIIAKDSGNWFNVFTIDKGYLDGVQIDNNILAGSGLAGIVTSVGPTWATVRAICDDNSNVSAMVTSTSDTCIIAGDLRLMDEGKINLVKLTDEDDSVSIGDKVVTSNISDRYLPGLLIGYISELNVDSNNLTKSGNITPVVDFRHLQEVLVIKELKEVKGAKEDLASQAESETEIVVESNSEESTESAAE